MKDTKKDTKAIVDTHKNNQTQKIRIRWIDRSPKQAQAAQQVRPELPELNAQLDKARKLNILRDAELGALLSERWQLARERREVAAERQDLRHERWELLQSRWTGWLQSIKRVMSLNVGKPALPRMARMDKLSKLTPIGQGILIWGFSGMALIGIGFLIARMRRRAAELRALDDMQDGAQLSVAKAIYTPHQKKSKSVKLWN